MKNQDSAIPMDLTLEGSGSLRTPRPLRRRIARLMFGIAPGETSFERRGFRWDSEAVRQRLEGVAGRFVEGYHAALEEVAIDSLAALPATATQLSELA